MPVAAWVAGGVGVVQAGCLVGGMRLLGESGDHAVVAVASAARIVIEQHRFYHPIHIKCTG